MQGHRRKHMANENQLPTKGKQKVNPAGDPIPDLPNYVIKIGNLEAPYEDRKPKISKQKLMPLKDNNKVNYSLARSRD